MADRPILFSAPMVLALLAGRKTQTRRICAWANNPNSPALTYIVACDEPGWFGDEEGEVQFHAGYAIGDRMWVRESYYQQGHWWEDATDLTATGKPKWKFAPYNHEITFDAPKKFLKARSRTNPAEIYWYKRLGRFMPRRYSRLTLILTDVRVERLQDCSEADAIAEGVEPGHHPDTGERCGWKSYEIIHSGRHKGQPNPHAIVPNKSPVTSYAELWDSINGEGAWEANPWVVAVSFEVRKGNIDA